MSIVFGSTPFCVLTRRGLILHVQRLTGRSSNVRVSVSFANRRLASTTSPKLALLETPHPVGGMAKWHRKLLRLVVIAATVLLYRERTQKPHAQRTHRLQKRTTERAHFCTLAEQPLAFDCGRVPDVQIVSSSANRGLASVASPKLVLLKTPYPVDGMAKTAKTTAEFCCGLTATVLYREHTQKPSRP